MCSKCALEECEGYECAAKDLYIEDSDCENCGGQLDCATWCEWNPDFYNQEIMHEHKWTLFYEQSNVLVRTCICGKAQGISIAHDPESDSYMTRTYKDIPTKGK